VGRLRWSGRLRRRGRWLFMRAVSDDPLMDTPA